MNSETDDATPRPNRRTIIRRAAAAGALAWTAPVIVDSLASPAAALSVTGCFRAEFVRTATTGCGTYARATPANGSGCFSPSVWNNLPDFPGSLVFSSTSSPCVYTITLEDGSGCTIDYRSTARADMSNNCSQGAFVSGKACHEVIFSPGFQPDRFKILIACGVVCPGGSECPPDS